MPPKQANCTSVGAVAGALVGVNKDPPENEQYFNKWMNSLTLCQKISVGISVVHSKATGDMLTPGPGLAAGVDVPPEIYVNKGQLTGEYFDDWIALAEVGSQRPAVINFGSCS